MGSQKTGLGRGFAALIPQDFDTTILVDEHEKIYSLNLEIIEPNPDQPRQYFDEEALNQLTLSIKQHGVVQPIVVTPAGDDRYTIIAGERRWRASKQAGLDKIPALVRTIKELEQLEIALIENVQRVDLSPIEQARSIERLHQQFNMTYDLIAERLGKAPSTVNNTVRLLQLPKPAYDALEAGKISEGHARAILALKGEDDAQAQLLEDILQQGWSVRQAERFVSSYKAGIREKTEVKARVATETPETKRLGEQLKTKVHIKRTARGGRLEISFKSDEELARIIRVLEK